jgi:hypothetical protein
MASGLAGLKVVAGGVLLVAESEQYTCHLQMDSLSELLKAHGAKMQVRRAGTPARAAPSPLSQPHRHTRPRAPSPHRPQTVPNSATDIVVLGSTAREKAWDESKKALGIATQQDAETTGVRKKPIEVLSFFDFAHKYKLQGAIIREATTVDYGLPPSKAAGLERARGTMLPRTLVSNAGSGVAKGLCSMFINDKDAYWPAE